MRNFRKSLIAGLVNTVLARSRLTKRILVSVLDVGLSVLAVLLAFYLRIGRFEALNHGVILSVLAAVCVAIPIFLLSGLYRAIFRFSGLPVMVSVGRAVLLYGVVYAGIFTFWGVEGVPRTIGLIQPMLLLLLVGASRAAARVLLGGVYHQQLRRVSVPQALIYGAGNAGRQLSSAMANSFSIRVVGFLDDDHSLQGNLLNGLPIYNPADFAEILVETKITDVLLALPSISRARRNKIIDNLKSYKVVVRTLPGISDLAVGKVSLSDVRDLDVDDLLGRESVKPDLVLLNSNTSGKTVVVTGAGGSIGSELCRQILKCRPKQLLLIDACEFALYQIEQELKALLTRERVQYDKSTFGLESSRDLVVGIDESDFAGVTIVPLLGSVCDESRMLTIMETWKPDTVYHAAAYKHVPMVEHNPIEGVRNNVFGTRVCAEVALRCSVRNFVLISSDKAVRPTNIMGATKRLAEMVLQAIADLEENAIPQGCTVRAKTVFSMVRFGNVLGSSGSVVPIFRGQVKNGGPITLTHLEMTRYFMTIPEAAQLVIQAGAMGRGGDVFVLDMGEPVKIVDLARRVVELSGLSLRDAVNPDGDIELSVTGLRPGEKLFEELLIGNDPELTQHPRILKAHEKHLGWAQLEDILDALEIAIKANNVLAVRKLLIEAVNEYEPMSQIVDWVYLKKKFKN